MRIVVTSGTTYYRDLVSSLRQGFRQIARVLSSGDNVRIKSLV